MRKRTLYLETSVFGFYFDEEPANREKSEAVRMLLYQIQEGVFEGVVSQFVAVELGRSEKIGLDHLKLLEQHCIKVIRVDDEEAEELASGYINTDVLPESLRADARHVACATILSVDVLVSLNLKHIVNTWRVRGFNAANLKMGYKMVEVAIPQEVIHYAE